MRFCGDFWGMMQLLLTLKTHAYRRGIVVMRDNLLSVYADLRRFHGYDATITTILHFFWGCFSIFGFSVSKLSFLSKYAALRRFLGPDLGQTWTRLGPDLDQTSWLFNQTSQER